MTSTQKKKKRWDLKKHLPGDSEANVVRENGGFVDIVVAMNSINAINHGNPKASGQRALLDLIHCVDPCLH